MSQHQGQCLCGSVAFTVVPKNSDVGVCHCDMCRKSNAGPFFALDCGDTLSFTKEDGLAVYSSSEWADRLFCKNCGSSIAWRLKDKSINIVAVDLIEGVGDLRLDHEVYIDSKPDYYDFAQDTTKMTEADVMKMVSEGQGA